MAGFSGLFGDILLREWCNKNRTSRLGVPSAILNDRSPRPGLPSCGLRPHSGRPGRGERSLSIASGTPLPCGSIILFSTQ